jgi:hypothetical protein
MQYRDRWNAAECFRTKVMLAALLQNFNFYITTLHCTALHMCMRCPQMMHRHIHYKEAKVDM